MTNDATPLTSGSELNDELKTLLRRAYEGDVEVEGGWECRNGSEHPDFDVVVTELTKNGDSA